MKEGKVGRVTQWPGPIGGKPSQSWGGKGVVGIQNKAGFTVSQTLPETDYRQPPQLWDVASLRLKPGASLWKIKNQRQRKSERKRKSERDRECYRKMDNWSDWSRTSLRILQIMLSWKPEPGSGRKDRWRWTTAPDCILDTLPSRCALRWEVHAPLFMLHWRSFNTSESDASSAAS